MARNKAILADSKAKQFCVQYNTETTTDGGGSFEILEILCKEHGLKTDSLHNYVNGTNLSKKNLEFLNAECKNLNKRILKHFSWHLFKF